MAGSPVRHQRRARQRRARFSPSLITPAASAARLKQLPVRDRPAGEPGGSAFTTSPPVDILRLWRLRVLGGGGDEQRRVGEQEKPEDAAMLGKTSTNLRILASTFRGRWWIALQVLESPNANGMRRNTRKVHNLQRHGSAAPLRVLSHQTSHHTILQEPAKGALHKEHGPRRVTRTRARAATAAPETDPTDLHAHNRRITRCC